MTVPDPFRTRGTAAAATLCSKCRSPSRSWESAWRACARSSSCSFARFASSSCAFREQVVQTSFSTGQTQTMLQGNIYYIVPWTNPLAQKLAASGQILTTTTNPCDPGSLPLPTPAPQSYPVTIVELDATPTSQSITAYVTVSAP